VREMTNDRCDDEFSGTVGDFEGEYEWVAVT